MFKNVLLMVFICSILGFTFQNMAWNIEPNYVIKFSGTSAKGTFTGLTGTLFFDPKGKLEDNKMAVSVDAKSIKTGRDLMDKHARGSSWFDVEKYPKITFTSSSFAPSGDKIVVAGILEMHGVQKAVQIPFTFTEKDGKGNFNGTFKVKRKEYGINGPFISFTVGDEFEINLNVPVRKK